MSSDSPLRTAPSRQRVGWYELATELESGALGPLFAARVATGSEEGRLVTVRRIPIEGCAPKEAQRLLEAARTARRVRHSKLAAVLDVVDAEREIAVVGEYFEGRTLRSLQRLAFDKRAAVPPAVALRIGLETLHGLRAVRETWKAIAPPGAGAAPCGGLLPDNVFVAAFGDVLLSEVGVSSAAGALAPFRELSAILAYRSPEQLARDGAGSLDERSDVFSVGVMLWELLANRPLFGDAGRLRTRPDDSNHELAERTRRDLQSKLIPALGSTERSGAPIARAAAEIVERALRRDPATRFSGIDQMLGALLALNREFLASAEQVQAAIDSLAGADLAAQRKALGSVSSTRPPPASVPRPDSSRPTLRPPSGSALAAAAVPRPSPRDSFHPQEPSVEQFSKHEAPTRPAVQPALAKAPVAKPASKPSASSASRSLPLPRLPKPPGWQSRISSMPPPPPMRKASTPPPPTARAGSRSSLPPPSALPDPTPPPPTAQTVPEPSVPPDATPVAPDEPTAAPPSASPASTPPPAPAQTAAPSSIPPAFGGPLPPLPELPEIAEIAEIAVPAVTSDPPTAAAPSMNPTAPLAASDESATPAASATVPFAPLRARRRSLVIGAAVGLVALMGLLRVMLRPATPTDSAATPSSATTGASVRAPAALPAPEPVIAAPPAASPETSSTVSAAGSAPPQQPENQALAPTKAVQNAGTPPPPAPPREMGRRPATQPEPQQKPFRPRGI